MVMDKVSPPLTHALLRLRPIQMVGLLIGLMLVSGGTGWWLSQSGKSEQSLATPASAEAPVQVKTAIAHLQGIETNRVLTGTVEPMETVTLTSRVMGQIRQLNVQEGDRVNAGDTLAVIDVADIQAQGGQALAGVNMAQSNYQNAQARLQESRAQLLEAEAELADAQLQQRRMRMLQSEGAVSQQLLDQANTRVSMTQARIQQIKAGITQSQATMNQAQAQVAQAQAQVAQVSANLNYGTITAPFDGVITRKYAEVGAMAGAGQSIVTLESRDRLRFTTQVPESLITQVRQGKRVSIHLDALNRDLSGTVSQIIPAADPATRNFTVRVTLNSTSDVFPGMFGRLKLANQPNTQNLAARTTLVIPQAAMVQQFGITGVYKVVNGQAAFQPITTGKMHGSDIEVFSGLKAGDRLVLEPPPDLKDGMAIQVN
ncbi:efflux RND transporter periplasmic adaptor subunit [Leptothermofonsia sichuanensis]|uniref:efflux RND transporter periplasmic adaptor subunit n=1 Tax=Leptothermofonsia sichuanensis TaxID=2917832 RepID=UPI001CED3DF0|nr:efflux RND transporter periplasmic adaptor subunit [Leptothermofonsia sichuanensis]